MKILRQLENNAVASNRFIVRATSGAKSQVPLCESGRHGCSRALPLLLYPSLVRTRDAHVFAVLGDGPASHLDALRLQNPSDLLVGKRTARVFLVNQFLDPALQDQQRRIATLRSLH